MDLVTFLRARLDELEVAASGMAEVFDPPWRVVDAPGYAPGDAFEIVDSDFTRSTTGCVVLREDDGGLPAEVANYFVRFDPARVLREVAAKRRVLARHAPEWFQSTLFIDGQPIPDPARPGRWLCAWCMEDITVPSDRHDEYNPMGWPCPDVLDVLSVFADHPDYDAAWSPDQ